ncbi:HEAT repeat domain-containing protein [Leptolyngbya sp. DQ-M1]|uniref:HEAT repeat domain-containing protein n=1 Tax=Leptolyngbya sp. DQ-M1 TaxID=2933920 RepID=UPI0032982A48
MQNLSYSEILEQAQSAANQQDWGQLTYRLQQILLNDELGETERSLFCNPNTTTVLLDLAMQVLEGGSFQERWEIGKLFPSFGTDAIAPLIELLNDEEAELEAQWFAVRILGSFKHPQVLEALIELLKNSQSQELNSMAVSVLASMGKSAVPMLEPLLVEVSTRLFAVQALGQIRRSETVPLLMQVVHDSNAQVRAIAIEALSSFHAPEVVTVLIDALQDPVTQVRLAAVAGLGFCQDYPNLVIYLRPMLLDLNLEVCRQAAISLGRRGTSEAARALYETLRSPHTPKNLAIELVRALSWMKLPESLNYLEDALLQLALPEAIQLEIIQSMGRIDSDTLKFQATGILLNVLPLLRSAVTRQAIALSLGQLGNVEALSPLIALLADAEDSVRFHAISALKTLNAELAHQQLKRLAKVEPEESRLGQGIAIALREWSF